MELLISVKGPLKQWPHGIAAILLGIFIFLALGEVGYRAYVYIRKPLYRPSEISGLLWEPNPGADVVKDGIRYKINSKGLRDYEYPMEKGKDVIRIAVIGDSVTWGYTELQDTYPKILERHLKNKYPNRQLEVINFGIEGTGTRHHLSILEERVLFYSPDIVILGFCLNDLLDNERYSRINPFLFWALKHSYFANEITSRAVVAARIIRANTGIMTPETYYLESSKLFEEQERISLLRTTLRRMKALTDQRGGKFTIVVFPFRQQFGKDATYLPQERLADVCSKEGIPFFDPIAELKHYNPDSLYLKDDVVHFSSFGNEVIAMAFEKFLKRQRL